MGNQYFTIDSLQEVIGSNCRMRQFSYKIVAGSTKLWAIIFNYTISVS